jgi:GMP synthase (glutamine-hydrolysing)
MSRSPRIRTRLWVQAVLRRCDIELITATVARSGDDEAGAVLIKLNRGADGCEIFTQVRDTAGDLAWMRAIRGGPVPEGEADAYIARAVDIDEDLWVIEVEDRAGRLPVVEPVIV